MADYGDPTSGFSLRVTSDWTEAPRPTDGDVCLRTRDGAVVTVSSSAPGTSVPADPFERAAGIFEDLSREAPLARQNWDAFRPIPGRFNVAGGQVLSNIEARGRISILHGLEYTIRYNIPTTCPYSTVLLVNDLVLSFRLRSNPDNELFIDPQKHLRERRRWWHFWRWLGR